jgi:hypothetical protein
LILLHPRALRIVSLTGNSTNCSCGVRHRSKVQIIGPEKWPHLVNETKYRHDEADLKQFVVNAGVFNPRSAIAAS